MFHLKNVLLHHQVIDLLSKSQSRYSISFDGWSNSSLKRFYSMTLHWACHETTRPRSMLLYFVHVFPCVRSGKCCAHALFCWLRSFDISSRLLATIFYGASDVQEDVKELSRTLQNEQGKDIFAPSHMLSSMVHNFQWCIKLRTMLHTIRSSKVPRGVGRKYARKAEHRERAKAWCSYKMEFYLGSV